MKELIKKYSFKNDQHLEFELLDLGKRMVKKGGMMTTPHRAQFYHILWIEKGKGTHYVDFKPIELEDHCLLFIPLDAVNLYDPKGTYEAKAIIFTDQFFCKTEQDAHFLRSGLLFNDLYPLAKIKLQGPHDDLETIFKAMENEYNREPDTAQYHILHNLLHIFLLQAQRKLKQEGLEELKPSINLEYLMLFKDLLEKNFRTDKRVSKYASDLSLSEKQLNKATTSLIEKTPKQIINERVILEAKRLLVHSNQSIKEIAYNLGYDEPTNFIKYFKKHCSSTPSEFRELY